MTTSITLVSNKLNNKKIALVLWVMFFCYSICVALIFQKVLLPLIPSMQATGGLLPNDSVYFHSVAMDLAEQIRLHGWSAWKLYPNSSTSVNIAILGALYNIFGYEPTLIIPLNAAAHALGGLLIYLISRELSPKTNIGIYAGFIASVLFVTFPSALNWYGQIHKDGYVIAGTLLILLTWLRVVNLTATNRSLVFLMITNLAGIALVISARPYNATLLLAVTLGALFLTALHYALKRQYLTMLKLMTFFIVSIFMLIGSLKVAVNYGAGASDLLYKDWQSAKVQIKNVQSEKVWQWENSLWMPDSIETYIINASKTRAGLIESGLSLKANSMIDIDVTPHSINETMTYLPRALQIALYAPFPSQWFTSLSITKLVAVGEMLVYYLSIPGVFLLLFYNRRPAVWLTVYFACFFLLVYGFTIANLGTLYRIRYVYLFLMLLMGVLGWLTWIDKTNRLNKIIQLLRPPRQIVTSSEALETINQKTSRNTVLGAGVIVMALTLLSFVGFFLRDIFMAHSFGLGSALDNFFIALMVPMFVVTVFSIPVGNAFIPIYLDVKQRLTHKAVDTMVSVIAFWVTMIALLICAVLYWFGPDILSRLSISKEITDLTSLLHTALPLLLFSGLVVLGNAVLNAHNRAIFSSGAQLIVPISAIAALFMFGSRYGVNAVLYGMVVGQLLNLLIIQILLRNYQISLIPKNSLLNHKELSNFSEQYYPQVISALFIALAVPAATLLAMSLPSGAVSALNLGSKIVLFITGLVSTVITAVILPYFSSLVVKNHLVAARRELSLFLLFSTFTSVPISFGMYVYSEQIIRLIFEGANFNDSGLTEIVRVMQYSVVQLPFFVCNALLLKFAVATKHVFAICIVAIIGLLITIGSSLLLMSHMGVAGIAFATSIAMLFSTTVLVLILVRYWHINYFDALILLFSWLLFITLLMGVHFKSVPSIYATILAYMTLIVAYFSSLNVTNSYEDKIPIEK